MYAITISCLKNNKVMYAITISCLKNNKVMYVTAILAVLRKTK